MGFERTGYQRGGTACPFAKGIMKIKALRPAAPRGNRKWMKEKDIKVKSKMSDYWQFV